jgi:hypothetical protein
MPEWRSAAPAFLSRDAGLFQKRKKDDFLAFPHFL